MRWKVDNKHFSFLFHFFRFVRVVRSEQFRFEFVWLLIIESRFFFGLSFSFVQK